MRIKIIVAALASVLLMPASAHKYVGGDISLLADYEAHSAQYYDASGQPIARLLPFFGRQGLNAMRLRLFVDPSKATDAEKGEGVKQDLDYVKSLGRRIKDAGFHCCSISITATPGPTLPSSSPPTHGVGSAATPSTSVSMITRATCLRRWLRPGQPPTSYRPATR